MVLCLFSHKSIDEAPMLGGNSASQSILKVCNGVEVRGSGGQGSGLCTMGVLEFFGKPPHLHGARFVRRDVVMLEQV